MPRGSIAPSGGRCIACARSTAYPESGEKSWAKLRLLVEICTDENEAAWLTRAKRITHRYLEREVYAARHRRDADPRSWRNDPGPRPLALVPPYAERSPVRPGAELWTEDAAGNPGAAGEPDAPRQAHTSARAVEETSDGAAAASHGAHTSARRCDDRPCRIRLWLPESVWRRWFDVDVDIALRLGAQPAAGRRPLGGRRPLAGRPWVGRAPPVGRRVEPSCRRPRTRRAGVDAGVRAPSR